MRELRFVLRLLQIRFRNLALFNTSFFLEFLGRTAWVIIYFFFFKVIFKFTGKVGGWDEPSVIMLVGSAGIVFALYGTFTSWGAGSISYLVRKGNLDFYLLKPISAPICILFRFADLPALFGLIPSIYIFCIGAKKVSLTIFGILLWTISILMSFLIYSFIHLLLGLLSFKFVNLPALTWIIYDIADYAKYPYKIFPKALQITFLYFVPILLVTNFPVLILKGEYHLFLVQCSILCAEIMLINVLFPIARRAYQGTGTYEG